VADPRALQDSISRQRGLIPPSEDQFYGQQLQRQPSTVESILKWLNNPTDPGIGPAGLEAPVGAGLVISEKNIPILYNRMRQMGMWPDDGSLMHNLDFALNFMKTKYPKIFALPDKIRRYPEGWPKDKMGAYYPRTNQVALNPGLNVPDSIDTVGHELTHAIQKKFGATFEDYIEPEVDFEKYWRQWYEVEARRGGATTLNAFDKVMEGIRNYLELHPDQIPPAYRK
jgi:hypothetical protein